MSNLTPFTLKIFVANGDPDGLRIVERTNWVGKAVVFPRSIFTTIKARPEFSQTGIYLLIGSSEKDGNRHLYIGEGDPVRPRLESHVAQKDFWEQAVFFVAGPGHLNKAHVQFLEARLVSRARTLKRAVVENSNQPTEPSLSEADKADMEVFLQYMLSILPILGIHAFEGVPPVPSAAKTTPAQSSTGLLYCERNGLVATGYESTQGFVVQAQSEATAKPSPFLPKRFPAIYKLRDSLISKGIMVLKKNAYVFTQDYVFNSPSAASILIMGRTSSGNADWHNKDRIRLRALRAAQNKGTTDDNSDILMPAKKRQAMLDGLNA